MDLGNLQKRITQHNPQAKGKLDGFTMIPNWFISSNNTSIYEKMVLIVLKMHSMNKNSCFPSIKTIAKEVNCSETTVKKAINALEDKGYIKKKANGRKRNNVYTIKLWGL